MIGGFPVTIISTRRHWTARLRLTVARTSAARTFLTQLHCPPSIGTRYHWPCQSAMPSGKRTIRPDRRPSTSRVTHRLGASPRPEATPHHRAKRRAVTLARPPAYISLSRSSDKRQLAIVLSFSKINAMLRPASRLEFLRRQVGRLEQAASLQVHLNPPRRGPVRSGRSCTAARPGRGLARCRRW